MKKLTLDRIEIALGDEDSPLTVYLDIYDNSLSRKWLTALNHLIENRYHLEKNYCFIGFAEGNRDAQYLCDQINRSIQHIDQANIGYEITEVFTLANTIADGAVGTGLPGMKIQQDKFNSLHRSFEDLQGTSGHMSPYYDRADAVTRWHIRQLNLLCHEYESLVMSLRNQVVAPAWQRPSQLMCWLRSPRFELATEDLELFGVETINRELGGVYVGVNKAVGKHHWEVFQDEGRDSRIGELTTTTLKSQTEAAGDFDIEWANNPGTFPWQIKQLTEFREWLMTNGFDPEDPALTIGHPCVGQVDLQASFGTDDYQAIWSRLNSHLNVVSIKTSAAYIQYPYSWSDSDYVQQQIQALNGT